MKTLTLKRKRFSGGVADFGAFGRSAPLALILMFGGSSHDVVIAKDARRSQTQDLPSAATIPFILDAQRILMKVIFEAPDGSRREALTWFNMGMPAPILTKALYHELGIDQGRPLTLRIGGLSVEATPNSVVDGDGGIANPNFNDRFSPYPIEAMVPASLLRQFVVTLDYQRRALTISLPGDRQPDGVAVPCTIDAQTGLVAVDVMVEGERGRMVVDAGSGYTWMRGSVLAHWLSAHPDWRRATGAVGASNYNMLDFAFEKEGVIARLPEMSIGSVLISTES